MINVIITAKLTESLTKTYLGCIENSHNMKEVIERIENVDSENLLTDFIELNKPATLIQVDKPVGVMPDMMDSVFIRTVNIKSIGKMEAGLSVEYTSDVSDKVINEDGSPQEIVQ